MDHVTVQGSEVPALGMGTWQLTGKQCYESVSTALELGYRHVDTAVHYGNEEEVGRAIADSDVDRDDVFLTTKVPPQKGGYRSFKDTVWKSLDRLDTPYVDLVLLHWPMPLVDFRETARAMADLVDDGLVRHAGVSNFRRWRLRKAREKSPVPLVTDQVQCHPFYTRESLREDCLANDMFLTAYSPLARGGLVGDDGLARIGDRYDKSAAQVALRWAVQREGVVPIPKATSREHLAANLAVFDFELTDEEMRAVSRDSLLRTAVLNLKSAV